MKVTLGFAFLSHNAWRNDFLAFARRRECQFEGLIVVRNLEPAHWGSKQPGGKRR